MSFNEAGAKSAGKRQRRTYGPCGNTRFNEAGAKSAGKLLRYSEPCSTRSKASMRPAQKAPEN